MSKMDDESADEALANSIGKGARAARRALELTQEDAADRIGVSAEFYARIERGNAFPSVQTLSRICAALGVSADQLFGRKEGSIGRARDPMAKWHTVTPPDDSPELRRLVRRLRKAPAGTLRLVNLLIKELEGKR